MRREDAMGVRLAGILGFMALGGFGVQGLGFRAHGLSLHSLQTETPRKLLYNRMSWIGKQKPGYVPGVLIFQNNNPQSSL